MKEIQNGDHLIVWRLDRFDRTRSGIVAALQWVVDRQIREIVVRHDAAEPENSDPLSPPHFLRRAGRVADNLPSNRDLRRQAARQNRPNRFRHKGLRIDVLHRGRRKPI